MLVGIAAARLQGAPVVTEDIDLWFAEGSQGGIAAAARQAGVVYVPGGVAMNPPTFGGRDVRLDQVLSLSGLGSFDEELANTSVREVNGIPLRVLNLERIIESKRARPLWRVVQRCEHGDGRGLPRDQWVPPKACLM
jgi:hypothetical protein